MDRLRKHSVNPLWTNSDKEVKDWLYSVFNFLLLPTSLTTVCMNTTINVRFTLLLRVSCGTFNLVTFTFDILPGSLCSYMALSVFDESISFHILLSKLYVIWRLGP